MSFALYTIAMLALANAARLAWWRTVESVTDRWMHKSKRKAGHILKVTFSR